MKRLLPLLVLVGACREPYVPAQHQDLGAPLPAVAWHRSGQTPLGQGRARMPIISAPEQHAFYGYGGLPHAQADPWVFSLKDDAWSKFMLSSVPPASRDGHCAVYLPVQTQTIFLGGVSQGTTAAVPPTLILPVGATNFQSASTDRPTPGSGCAAAYLARLSGAIAYGGDEAPDETWLYNGVKSTWTRLQVGTSPGGRVGASLVEAPGANGDGGISDFLVLFGGLEGGIETDSVWFFDGTAWANVPTSADPSATVTDEPRPVGRARAAVAIDTSRRALYVFGGLRQGVYLADSWRLDLGKLAWERLVLDDGPSGRADASAAYDPVLDRMMIFGGQNESGLLNDAWSLQPTS